MIHIDQSSTLRRRASHHIRKTLHELIHERDLLNYEEAKPSRIKKTIEFITNTRISLDITLSGLGEEAGEETRPPKPKSFEQVQVTKDFQVKLDGTPMSDAIQIIRPRHEAFADSDYRPVTVVLNSDDFAKITKETLEICASSYATVVENPSQPTGYARMLAVDGYWLGTHRSPEWIFLVADGIAKLKAGFCLAKVMDAVVSAKPAITVVTDNAAVKAIESVAMQSAYHFETAKCDDRNLFSYVHLTAKYLPEGYKLW